MWYEVFWLLPSSTLGGADPICMLGAHIQMYIISLFYFYFFIFVNIIELQFFYQ